MTNHDRSAKSDSRARARRHTLFVDRLSVAAEAVALGSTHAEHWNTLAAFARREGIAAAASAILACRGDPTPSRDWWHYTLLSSVAASAEEQQLATRALLEIEAAGGGPTFSVARHAVQVETAVRCLREHLARVHAGRATREEMAAMAGVVAAVRGAGGGRERR